MQSLKIIQKTRESLALVKLLRDLRDRAATATTSKELPGVCAPSLFAYCLVGYIHCSAFEDTDLGFFSN